MIPPTSPLLDVCDVLGRAWAPAGQSPAPPATVRVSSNERKL